MNEREFIKLFKKYCDKEKILCEYHKSSTQSKYADCEIIYEETLIKLEAKMFADSRNDSGKFYQAIGQAIANRSKGNIIHLDKGRAIKYGFLIPENAKEKFEKYWRQYSLADRRKLIKYFEMEYLVIFDEANGKLRVKKLKNLK